MNILFDYNMTIINYQFADGHTEEIEVTEEVAAAFEELQKYGKKVERKETRRHISLDMLKEKGFEFPDPSGDIIDAIDKREAEASEQQAEKQRRAKLAKRKKQLERLLTPRQAEAYFKFEYLKIKKLEIAKSMGVTEGAVRKLIAKAETNLPKIMEELRAERGKELLLLTAIFGAVV